MIKNTFVAATLCLLSVAGGCAQFNNPFCDELRCTAYTTTPSVEGIRSIQATRHEPHRDYATVVTEPMSLPVAHGPLFFEDPSEEIGSEDGQFAWTGEDYLQFVTWRARFLGNLIALPVSIVVTPPWVVQESDGVLEPNWFCECHDAKTVCKCWCKVKASENPCTAPVEVASAVE